MATGRHNVQSHEDEVIAEHRGTVQSNERGAEVSSSPRHPSVAQVSISNLFSQVGSVVSRGVMKFLRITGMGHGLDTPVHVGAPQAMDTPP
jgi:hypothetical protein